MALGSSVLDCSVRVDWQGRPRIGEFEERDGFKNRRRAAYDDRFKLLVHFPVDLEGQRIVKNAAFDVCQSGLENTFYNSWEGIKHNVILDWVDVVDGEGSRGMALFSDHTTSYAHGAGHALSLTVQYAGKGLWGRDYGLEGATEFRYGLMPHAGNWDEAGVPVVSAAWQEPAWGELSNGMEAGVWSAVDPGDAGWVVPAVYQRDGAVYVRLFNASGDESMRPVGFGFRAGKADLVELDGRVIEELSMEAGTDGGMRVRLGIPRLGVRTVRLSGIEVEVP
jgi:alpha-mannosidase